jgi:hypothetical protein
MRGLAVIVVAVAVILPGVPPSASATVASTADRIITVGFSIFRFLDDGLTDGEIEALVRVAIEAVVQARDETISHLDAQQAATAKAAAISASNEFTEFNQIRRDELGLELWTMDVGRSGTAAKEQFNVVVDRRAADQIGLAVNVIYPIALAGADQARWTNYYNRLRAEYIEVNQNIVQRLAPICHSRPAENDHLPMVHDVYWICTAANGEQSAPRRETRVGDRWVQGPVNLDPLRDEAAVNSSWMVAKEVLARMPQ